MADKQDDMTLPNTVVLRLIKEALPDGVTVGKEARVAVVKAACIFILFLTSSANTVAKKVGRKTITGPDVLKAIENIELDNFIEPLKEALENFKKSQQEKKDANTKKKQQRKDEDDGTDIAEDE